jgi:ATP dependent DNA ligase-like protein
MLCDTAEQPPDCPEWRYELKLNGYRAIGFKTDGQAQLWSRNGKNFVRQFLEVAKAIESVPEDTAIDGEIVALDADGKPSFALLQGSGAGAAPVVFYAFDLLMLRGRGLRLSRLLEERRKRLRKVVDRLPASIRYSRDVRGPGGDARAGGPGEWTRRHRHETGGQCVEDTQITSRHTMTSCAHFVVKLFLELRLPRPCRRSIAFTKTLTAAAIPPLHETRSQVIAPAIAANQLI